MTSQILIAFTGLAAIWLSQSRNESQRKYSCIFGLAGQPFWFYSAYTTQQWGILILTVFYTLSWVRGIKNSWFIAKEAE